MEPLKTLNCQTFATEPNGRRLSAVSFGAQNIDQAKLTKGTRKADDSRCLLIGFDTEYRTFGAIEKDVIDAGEAQNEILSYQYCIKLLDQGLASAECPEVSGIIVPDADQRIALQDFVAFAIGALIEAHPHLTLPSDVYLVGHFTRADMSAFSEFRNYSQGFLSNVRSTFVSIDGFMPVLVQNDRNETIAKLKLHVRDTMLMAPGNAKSLADLGHIVGFDKLILADTPAEERKIKENMHLFREANWEAFREYAIRDAEVCVRYAERVIGQFWELFSDFKLPLTLTQFGTRLVLENWENSGHEVDDMLGREEVEQKVYSESRRRYIKVKTHPYVEEIFFDIPFVTETYHGGRNEQFEFGICPEGRWRDHDLSSAYTTAMSLIGKPRWREARPLTDIADIGPLDLAFCSVDFEFPTASRFPVLPVRTSNGIVFPLAGRSFCAAPEIELARRMGAKLTFRRGISVPVDKGEPIFKDFITSCIAKRSEHPKNSFGNLFWKEVGNSSYGKTAQGLLKKRVFDLKSGEMVPLPESPITQPFFASFITSFTRAVLGEILNSFPPDVRVFSVTTDGFLSNASDEQISKACSGPLFQAFANGRLALDSSAQPLEIKHEIRQPLGWRTRGSATLKPGDDPEKGIVLQKGGIKTPDLMGLCEQNDHIVQLFLGRTPSDRLEYSVGIGLKDMVRKKADFVHKAVTKRLSMEFDWKRMPIDAGDISVDVNGVDRTHLSFSTAPHPDIQSFERMREAWDQFDSRPRRNLKSLMDLQRFLNFVDTRRHPGHEVQRYISREDGDIKRLRRDLCRAFTHSAAGFDLVKARSKYVYRGFAAALSQTGIPCLESDVDNGKRNSFKPKQTIPTDRVVAALRQLKATLFPELEIEQFLANEEELDHDSLDISKAAA